MMFVARRRLESAAAVAATSSSAASPVAGMNAAAGRRRTLEEISHSTKLEVLVYGAGSGGTMMIEETFLERCKAARPTILEGGGNYSINAMVWSLIRVTI